MWCSCDASWLTLRPPKQEAFLRLSTLPGEQGQADWAHFGTVTIGRALRRLSCFVLTLSYSRALYLEFFLDQSLENFLLGHVHALATARRLLRDPSYPPLNPIRSLHYFLPVIEELLDQSPPQAYFDYLRSKLAPLLKPSND